MANRKSSLRSRLLVSTAALAMIPLSAIAQEQEEEEDMVTEDEEIVLGVVTATGIRGSIADSLAAKRYSDSVIEAISAEDIGKLPDLSIADALARLPGVTAQRVRGRSQTVSIRGLGPDFSLALLNGREIVSASNNRGIEFDQFPSELIAQGIVYKTPDARLNATGIAGAVDLRTVRPLEYDERKLNVSGKFVQGNGDVSNPDFDRSGYRLFGSVIDKSEDGTIGWAVALTLQSNPTAYLSRELKTGDSGVRRTPHEDAPSNAPAQVTFPYDNPRSGVVSRDFERTSLAGTLQFEPNEQTRVLIDGFFTDTEDKGIFRGVETPLATWGGATVTEIMGSSGGFATQTGYTGFPMLRTDEEGASAKIQAFGINAEYDVSDKLTLVGDLSISSLDRSDIDYESYGGLVHNRGDRGNLNSNTSQPCGDAAANLCTRDAAIAEALDTFTIRTPSSGEYSIKAAKDYTDKRIVFLTNPHGWGGQMGFINEPKVEDQLTSLRLEADYELENRFFSGVIGGLLYSDREKSYNKIETYLGAGTGWTDGRIAIPDGLIQGSTDSGSLGLNIIAYNTASLISSGVYNTTNRTNAKSKWNVSEKVITLYAMGDIDYVYNDVPVRGNVGLQLVSTKQSSTAKSEILAKEESRAFESDYMHFLPSVNLNFEVTDDSIVRVALAKTITRARLDQLAATRKLNFDNTVCTDTTGGGTGGTDPDKVPDTLVRGANNTPVFDPSTGKTCFTLSGGNPELEPFESFSFDLAFERYFDDVTAVSFALFHKALDSWVTDRTRIIDATELINYGGGGPFLTANSTLALGQTKWSGQDNATDGTITGFEATLRLGLDEYLPEQYEGLGFNFSYTYADASVDHPSGSSIDIPGYSKTVWSWDVYYENHGWRARLNSRYRAEFLSEVLEFTSNLTTANALEETVFDLQVGYSWDEGPMEGFSVNFEIFNLTDEPFVTEKAANQNPVPFPSQHELYGTTMNLTVSKKF